MSRTYRRGRPSRDLQFYRNRDVIWDERFTYTLPYPIWMDGEDDPRTYAQYVEEAVRRYHQEKLCLGLPRSVRRQDVGRQQREHARLIHIAVRTGDYDVALTKMAQAAAWHYW